MILRKRSFMNLMKVVSMETSKILFIWYLYNLIDIKQKFQSIIQKNKYNSIVKRM